MIIDYIFISAQNIAQRIMFLQIKYSLPTTITRICFHFITNVTIYSFANVKSRNEIHLSIENLSLVTMKKR